MSLGGAELLHAGEVRLAPGATSDPVGLRRVLRQRPGRPQPTSSRPGARPARSPRSPRPVVLNTWEAVYFDHDLDHLITIAEHAAKVGVERFVLDDGWFTDEATTGPASATGRSRPTSGRRDPSADRQGRRPRHGLRAVGEPEMVNLDSDLVRRHPEWLLAPAGRLPPHWRHQQVLDLAHADAWRHIFERLDALLTDHDIAYLKWTTTATSSTPTTSGVPDCGHRRWPSTPCSTPFVPAPRRRDRVMCLGGGRIDLEVLARTDRISASGLHRCAGGAVRCGARPASSVPTSSWMRGHMGTPNANEQVLDLGSPEPRCAASASVGRCRVSGPKDRAELGALSFDLQVPAPAAAP